MPLALFPIEFSLFVSCKLIIDEQCQLNYFSHNLAV